MAANVNKWSETPASNATADPAINWAEGQAPSTVNDSARQMMAAIAADRDDTRGSLTFGGTSAALTLATNSVNATYQNGLRVSGKLASAFTAAATLNVDSVGAKNIYRITGAGATAIQPSDGVTGQHVAFEYDASLNSSAGGWVFIGEAQGRLINIQVLTSSGTYTRSPGASIGDVFLLGGPGGGGGCVATGAGQFSVGAGGGSGAFTAALSVALPATATIAIGAKGTVTVGAPGGAGGTTTFTGGTLTLTAPGGAGGTTQGPASTSFGAAQGQGGVVGTFTGGTFSNPGNAGNMAIGGLSTGIQALGGFGGVSPMWGYSQGGNGSSLGPSSSASSGFQGTSAAIIVFERS